MKHVHFIGIAGSGMAPLARLARERGYTVTGSDSGIDQKGIEDFSEEGITVCNQHSESNVKKKDAVIYSTAVGPDHIERNRATAAGIDFHRMDFLLELMKGHTAFAVAGTHGKTSTTSLLGFLLLSLGLDPVILAGGRPLYLLRGFRNGSGPAVYETDESDGSFLKTEARYRLVLNIDADHLDYYGCFEKLKDCFARFAEGGQSVLNLDDQNTYDLFQILNRSGRNVTGFTVNPDKRKQALLFGRFIEGDVMQVFCDSLSSEPIGQFQLKTPGKHFAMNTLGALSLLAVYAGENKQDVLSLLKRAVSCTSDFPGVERRLEWIADWKHLRIYDDYGHHPVEIEAVLSALQQRHDFVAMVFQPHRYSRTAEHFERFAEILEKFDLAFLLPIYSAGEKPDQGKDHEDIYAALSADHKASGRVRMIADIESVFHSLPDPQKHKIESGALLFQGAGSISKMVRAYLASQQ